MGVPYGTILRLARIHLQIKYSMKEHCIKFIGSITFSVSCLLSFVIKYNLHLLFSLKS